MVVYKSSIMTPIPMNGNSNNADTIDAALGVLRMITLLTLVITSCGATDMFELLTCEVSEMSTYRDSTSFLFILGPQLIITYIIQIRV